MAERKVVLYIATSLDGYIARPDGNLDFLSLVEEKGQDYGYEEFIQTVDTVIIGRKAYDKVLSMVSEFPHKDKETYVITRTPRPAVGSTRFYTESLEKLVAGLKSKPGKTIFVDGGAEIVNLLLEHNLIDEYYISVIPILLGDGIPLFRSGRQKIKLKLIGTQQFEKGLVQVHYSRL